MTRRWTGLLVAACGLAFTGLGASAVSAFSAVEEEPQRAQRDAENPQGSPLVFLGSKRPVLLHLKVEMDGQPVQKTWQDYLKKWFDYLDRDGDGKLDAQELRFAPQGQAMLQLMRQGFYQPNPKNNMRMADFGKKDDEKLTLEDFCRYYQSKSAGPMQMGGGGGGFGGLVVVDVDGANFVLGGGGGTPNAGLGDALFKVLDLNKDGKLSREELEQAEKTLLKLDTDDDEWITPAEILPAANAGFGPGMFVLGQPQPQQSSGSFLTPPAGADGRLALLLLAHYDRDKDKKLSRQESGLSKEAFDRLDTNKDGMLDAEELSRWHMRPADLAFTIRLGKTAGQAVTELMPASDKKLAKSVAKSGDGQLLMLGDAEIKLRRDDGGGNRMFVDIDFLGRTPYGALFKQADSKKRGFVEVKDLEGDRRFFPLIQLFPMLDRDGDGKLTDKEIEAFARLTATATTSYVSLSVSEYGRNLFQLLDADGDGRLSLREMRAAWSRLKDRDTEERGYIELTDLARQFQLVVERGSPGGRGGFRLVGLGGMQPPLRAPAYPANTPGWFKKMDRNGDGVVSLREFLGTREEFNRMDADRDGLITPEEAAAYEARLREQKK